MTALEQAARIAWIGWGAYAQWTICAECNEWRYCRARRSHRFLCLACFDQEAGGRP